MLMIGENFKDLHKEKLPRLEKYDLSLNMLLPAFFDKQPL